MTGHLFDAFFLIFTGSAIVASLALFTRQPLLVAYIAVGVALGPYGLKIVPDINIVSEISHIGIVFLLFLLGLDMQPSALHRVFKEISSTAIISSLLFASLGYTTGLAFAFTHTEALVLGMTMMFSSTIIGIKLLPTTVLHHKQTGELMVGLLLFQDFLAIICLLILARGAPGEFNVNELGLAFIALPALGIAAFSFVRYVLLALIARFDRFHEYIFLIAIGWCLGLAELAQMIHLSAEIGAFIAGISLATSPISQFIALNLKPLRDFFLILFFFALGAQLNIALLPELALPIIAVSVFVLTTKPITFYALLCRKSGRKGLAWDIGFRLGQISEFSLLLAIVASSNDLIGERVKIIIQSAAIVTFIVSSYIVIFCFPNPIAISEKLRRD
ncbi:cation:proton antiporter [Marinagarivorans algicola]|uniref:cation:proton antiporter domain-containing protein n=1 Tax=Marinagarivorans algicola TaxID=1513270 RepID=UPI0006B9C926|nr:cation:proton antiporter [Marinagarivorans algicola]